MQETHIAGAKVAVVIRTVVHQPGVKRFWVNSGLFQKPGTYSPPAIQISPIRPGSEPRASPDPRSSPSRPGRECPAHDLSGRADFGNLRGHAGLSQRDGVLVHRNNIAATERHRESILRQPVRHKKLSDLSPSD